MKFFIKLDQYYNIGNPAQGAVLLFYDNSTKRLNVIQKDNTLLQLPERDIPQKLSQLENDTRFITLEDINSDNINLDGLKTELKNYVDSKVTRIFTFKGRKSNIEQLPTDAQIGDVYSVGTDEYVYTGSKWEALGPLVDLSSYATKAQVAVKANTSYVDSQLLNKVNKIEGKSLIADQEIRRLAGVRNYDDTDILSSLNTKANIIDVYNKTQIDQALSGKVDKVDGKSLLSNIEINRLATLHNYDDSQLRVLIDAKANKADSLADYGITDAYTKDEIQAKGYLTQHQSLSAYTTIENMNIALSSKVDTVNGKSLIDDSEISRLANVHNYDDTDVKTMINLKVNKVDGKSLILDTEISRLANVDNYNDTQVRTILSAKANTQDVYSKTDIDQKKFYNSILNFMKPVNSVDQLKHSTSGFLYCLLEDQI